MRLAAGPASAVTAIPTLGFLKRRTSVGTGLAHPTPATTMQMVPSKSKWRSGLRDSRPWSRAVESPIR